MDVNLVEMSIINEQDPISDMKETLGQYSYWLAKLTDAQNKLAEIKDEYKIKEADIKDDLISRGMPISKTNIKTQAHPEIKGLLIALRKITAEVNNLKAIVSVIEKKLHVLYRVTYNYSRELSLTE